MKKRWEIEEKDTWRLEDMVESDARWEELYAPGPGRNQGIREFQGKLEESADMLYGCLAFDDALSEKLERLYVYARMRSDEDTAKETYQDMFSRAQTLSFKAGEASAFVVPEILSIPQKILEEYRRSDNGIRHFDRVLDQILEKKAHTLPKEQELLLAQSQDATQGYSQIFTMFNNADVKFPPITGENGQALPVTHGNYISLMENQDRRIRRDAFFEPLQRVCPVFQHAGRQFCLQCQAGGVLRQSQGLCLQPSVLSGGK